MSAGKLTGPQARVLALLKAQGRCLVEPKLRKTVRELEALGLVKVERVSVKRIEIVNNQRAEFVRVDVFATAL